MLSFLSLLLWKCDLDFYIIISVHGAIRIFRIELLGDGWSYWEMDRAIGRCVSFSLFLVYLELVTPKSR